MAPVLLVVKSNVAAEHDAEFNRWYDEVHMPQVLAFGGSVSGRRYQLLDNPPASPVAAASRYKYLACHEFEDEAAVRRFFESPERAARNADRRARFGVPDSESEFFVQLWP